MMHKLNNRGLLRKSEWLAGLQNLSWEDVKAPAAETLAVQQIDLFKNIDGESISRQLGEKFKSLSHINLLDERRATDGEMAVFLHKILDGITRREASDPDFWAFLTVVACPQYGRWRWAKEDADLQSRFLGAIQRNSFSRLWWWAEITHDPEKLLDDPHRYLETVEVRGRQDLVMYCLDCLFAGHSKLVQALSRIQKAKAIGPKGQQKLCGAVNRIARMFCLDSLTHVSEVEDFCGHALEISQFLKR